MYRVRVIPTLLLQNGGLVKTIRFKKPKYIGDPINAVKIFNDKEVDEIVLLDIEATKKGLEPNYSRIKDICSEAFMPFAYGGGIKKIAQAKKIFDCGIEKVVLNTSVFENPGLVEKIASVYGSQSVVISVDVKTTWYKRKYVFSHSGTKNRRINPIDFASHAEKLGAGELVVNNIDREGTYKGYDLELIKRISETVSIPVVALGGASCLDDFGRAINMGASAVAAGSLFVYSGNERGILINYPSQDSLKNYLL